MNRGSCFQVGRTAAEALLPSRRQSAQASEPTSRVQIAGEATGIGGGHSWLRPAMGSRGTRDNGWLEPGTSEAYFFDLC